MSDATLKDVLSASVVYLPNISVKDLKCSLVSSRVGSGRNIGLFSDLRGVHHSASSHLQIWKQLCVLNARILLV